MFFEKSIFIKKYFSKFHEKLTYGAALIFAQTIFHFLLVIFP